MEYNFQNSRHRGKQRNRGKEVSSNTVRVKGGSKGEGNGNSDRNKSRYVNIVNVSGLSSAVKDQDGHALQHCCSHPQALLCASPQRHTIVQLRTNIFLCDH